MELTATDIKKRCALLKQLPLFSSIPESILTDLAKLFHDAVYPKQQYIVKENEMVDSFFILVQGSAEVSSKKEIIAVLHEGETIGLSDVGFYSDTGMRTATVTALTSVFVLRIELIDFKNFLQSHPTLIPEMHQSAEKMLRQNFIKKVEPFTEIDHAILQQIITHIEEMSVPANTILFQQNEEAECCYLLREGKVSISLAKTDHSEEILSELEPGTLFGEMALLTNDKRNATAKTLSDSKLLVLKREDFQKIVQQSTTTSAALISLMMDRHRPQQSEGITVHTRQDAAKQTIIILKNAKLGAYFKTSEEGLFIWHRLNGERTIQEIAIAFFYKFHKLAIDDIGNLVIRLMQSGFVKIPTLATYVQRPALSKKTRLLTALRNIMQYEYSLPNVDAWVTRHYQKWGHLFFTRLAKILMSLTAIIGFIAFIRFSHQADAILATMPNAWHLLIWMIPINIFSVPLHELAHAFTTKAYGNQVHRFGIGWFWVGPIAFADTSDMWLNTRGPRIAVNLAGIYINMVMAGLLAILASFIASPTLAVFLWLIALFNYLLGFYNLNPLLELDGYYVLMDALDKPNLRSHAITWLLSKDFKKTFFSTTLMKKYFPEILYWITSILFIFLSAAIAYFFQEFVLNNFFPEEIGNVRIASFKWALTFLIIILSFASLYSKVKQHTYLYYK